MALRLVDRLDGDLPEQLHRLYLDEWWTSRRELDDVRRMLERSHRSEGLGARLMDEVIGHPRLSAVRHFELYCRPGLVPFYERWGFTDRLGELRFLRRGPSATPSGPPAAARGAAG